MLMPASAQSPVTKPVGFTLTISPVSKFSHEIEFPEAVTKLSCAYGTPAAQPVVWILKQQSVPQHSEPESSLKVAVILVIPIYKRILNSNAPFVRGIRL
jgi:hypothetical protein